MAEMRVCHVCGTETDTFCPTCVRAFETRKPADVMTPDERRMEMELLFGPLEIPFDKVHQRIEELVGRPVWTHEMGLNSEGLIREAEDRVHPSMEGVVDQLRSIGKPVIVVEMSDAEEDR